VAERTKIGWTSSTWNPVTGCTKVSPGCDNCYAEVIAERFRGGPPWPMGFDLQLRPNKLHDPATWREPRRIFVNSMSDLFHRAIPDDYLEQIWEVMTTEAPHHTYQILTKRPHRAARKIQGLGLPLTPNIWIGTSVENQQFADNRIPALLDIPVRVRFLSCEPLLGPIDLSEYISAQVNDCQTDTSSPETRDALRGLVAAASKTMGPTIDWVITGGESGAKRRPLDLAWVRAIRDKCLQGYVPFFHKQGSALGPGLDRELDGRTWNQYPPDPPDRSRPVQLTLTSPIPNPRNPGVLS